jgi:hypothetical protein
MNRFDACHAPIEKASSNSTRSIFPRLLRRFKSNPPIHKCSAAPVL